LMKKSVGGLAAQATREELELIAVALDTNASGSIDLNEFEAFVRERAGMA
jgi:Ca2+-binding EF-hand superfamily protein